ncbi:hypothetical protein [Fusibacter ferrireducens]|uniref:Uncharacterized protein n=1 Tax=Fusibacter ferrireducens TaxID=2785058 RepID=A0ABR9ZUY5_9FIRM|nr:hypothetical protein [Fusibacter ferrireducens]MBF4694250.1 hypothetical protein [Fusibacter ferrireducens]
MRTFKRFVYRTDKKASDGEILAQMQNVLIENNYNYSSFYFYFSDNNNLNNRSNIDRIIKEYPYLAAFEIKDYTNKPFKPEDRIVCNYDKLWSGFENNYNASKFKLEDIIQIAYGIRKKYYFYESYYNFYNINWGIDTKPSNPLYPFERSPLSLDPANDKLSYSSSLYLVNDWWYPTRYRRIVAIVEFNSNSNYKLELKKIEEKLSKLGRKEESKVVVEMTLEEIASRKSKEIDIKNQLDLIKLEVESNIIPNKIPIYPNDPSKSQVVEGSVSVKESLKRAFKNTKYSYDSKSSALGFSVLKRVTNNNNIIYVQVDSGTWSRSISCNIVVQYYGISHYQQINIMNSKYSGTGHFGNQTDVDNIVDNIHIILEELEETKIRDLDELMGVSPAFFLT